jgi:DNA-binding NarL/FixJ family response regulator
VSDDNHDQPLRILIVEDDPRVRTALRTFLSEDGFEVVGDAATAATALQIARERAPAVVLVDVLMPDVPDGIELLRTLTGDLRIPAVAISIHGWVRSDALAAGAYRFLDKDSAPELMVAALRAAASR